VKIMRKVLFATLIALTACATVPSGPPALHYADAASRGAWAALLAGRPNQRQVDRVTENWSTALGDSFACHVPTRDAVDAGLAGALEIGAMNAAASGGGQREVREGVERYLGQLTRMALAHRERPSAARCEAMTAWAPRVAADGREAVARAQRNGLMDDDYGLILDLLGR
jgi:hypothetical protein